MSTSIINDVKQLLDMKSNGKIAGRACDQITWKWSWPTAIFNYLCVVLQPVLLFFRHITCKVVDAAGYMTNCYLAGLWFWELVCVREVDLFSRRCSGRYQLYECVVPRESWSCRAAVILIYIVHSSTMTCQLLGIHCLADSQGKTPHYCIHSTAQHWLQL